VELIDSNYSTILNGKTFKDGVYNCISENAVDKDKQFLDKQCVKKINYN
jgi:hypothetical protein